MKKYDLKAKKRKVVGKKVKRLRSEGILPASVYGKKVKSASLEINLKDFRDIYQKAGETGIVSLQIEGETKERPVLIHNVQRHPVDSSLLHADFHQIELTEKVKAEIPVVLLGESPAVKEKRGLLLHLLKEIEVEALPADLPEKIEVDVASLKDVDQEIKIENLKITDKVTVLTPINTALVRVSPLVTKEAEKLVKEEEAKAAEAAAQAAAVSGEAGAAPAAVPQAEASKEGAKKKPSLGGKEKPTPVVSSAQSQKKE